MSESKIIEGEFEPVAPSPEELKRLEADRVAAAKQGMAADFALGASTQHLHLSTLERKK